MKRWVGWLLVALLAASVVWLRSAWAAPATCGPTDGLLLNGGFEGSFYQPSSDEWVADGWTRLHLQGSADWDSTQRFAEEHHTGWVERIECDNSQIVSGEVLDQGLPFETVLYQQATGLTPGRAYSLSGWVLKMWGGSANDDPPADPHAFGSRVGIDPTGGTNPNAPSVVWGDWGWQSLRDGHWEWQNHRVAAVAQEGTMTLFVRLWHKWERDHTQAIVDAMELFDAPTATLHTPSGTLTTPFLDWSGTLPQSLLDRGNFALRYEVQREQAGGTWVAIASDLENDDVGLPLPDNQRMRLRVVPSSYQPAGQPVTWPPSTHVGMPTAPITVTTDFPDANYSLFLPLVAR